MVSKDDVGRTVRYWKNGWRFGILSDVDKNTAEVKHPVLKKIQKVPIADCEPHGERGMPTVYESLLKAAQTVSFDKQRADETDDEHLTGLVKAIQTISDQEWAKLPKDAQEWYNTAAINVNQAQARDEKPRPRDNNPLLGFQGKDQIEETKQAESPQKGLSATELLSKTRASRFQASTPNPTVKTEKGKKGKGYMDAVRRTVLIHPDWTSRQIYDYLKLNGYPEVKLDTISVDGGNVRRVIELAKEMGFWRVDEPKVIEQPGPVEVA